MATCLQTYLTAKDASEQQLATDLAACNGSQSCEDAAIAAHASRMATITANYFACRNSSGGGGGGSG